jgi:hypothetical protein
VAVVVVTGPDTDVANTLAALGSGREEVTAEDPLDWFVQTDVEGDRDRVGIPPE